jgi:hypothetical protein
MAVKELVEWIKNQIEEGRSENDIRAVLKSSGWSDTDINLAFDEIKREEKPIEKKSKFFGPAFALAAALVILFRFFDIKFLFFALDEIFAVLFGILLAIGAGLLWAERIRFGASLIIISSILHFAFFGQIFVLAIGIISGILGFKKM